MNTERNKQGFNMAMQRKSGMTAGHQAFVDAENNKRDDWFRLCKDGRKVMGTREQVLKPCACDGK